jgi:predicted HD phosphohydrolase
MLIEARAHPLQSVSALVDWIESRAGCQYGIERVSQLEHALKCAALAHRGPAPDALIVAALLHDVGHLLQQDLHERPTEDHAVVGARFLAAAFPQAVTEPVRLHAEAKRFLVATDPLYFARLSPASQRSLRWQGGAMSPDEVERFIAHPHAADAIRLRRWDEESKDPGRRTAPLSSYRQLLGELITPVAANVAPLSSTLALAAR